MLNSVVNASSDGEYCCTAGGVLCSCRNIFRNEAVVANQPDGNSSTTVNEVLSCLLQLTSFQILWPASWVLSWLTSNETIEIYAWFVMFVFGGLARHFLRTVLPLVFSNTTFP
jgi:hypothetical protein